METKVNKILSQHLYTVEPWDSHHPNATPITKYVDLNPVKMFIIHQQELLALYKKYYKAKAKEKMWSHHIDWDFNQAKYRKLARKYMKQIKILEGIMNGTY